MTSEGRRETHKNGWARSSEAMMHTRLTVCHAEEFITVDGGTKKGSRAIYGLPEVRGRRGLEGLEIYVRARGDHVADAAAA